MYIFFDSANQVVIKESNLQEKREETLFLFPPWCENILEQHYKQEGEQCTNDYSKQCLPEFDETEYIQDVKNYLVRKDH